MCARLIVECPGFLAAQHRRRIQTAAEGGGFVVDVGFEAGEKGEVVRINRFDCEAHGAGQRDFLVEDGLELGGGDVHRVKGYQILGLGSAGLNSYREVRIKLHLPFKNNRRPETGVVLRQIG